MKTTERDIHIKILKYAVDNPGFSFQNIVDAFSDQKEFLHKEILKKQIFINSSNDSYMLTFEGRMFLLEYEELKDARKSSRIALIVAIISILLTLISIVSTNLINK